jgi:NADH-quinone oxidoreductase subunit H
MLELIGIALLKVLVIALAFVMPVAAVLTWIERKMSAIIQDRVGPNRAQIAGVRAFGIFHLIADTLKMLSKEDFDPKSANPVLFKIAPFLAVVPPLLVFAIIPFGPGDPFIISNLGVGILLAMAIQSLGVYGTTIGAWASNNNFALLGSIRSAAQMVSYEVAMGLNLIGVLMVYQSVDLQVIIAGQGDYLLGFIPKWGIVVQPVAFVLFMVASMAETKRAPFDMPEGESEIVGYFVEYSSMRFGIFALSEFIGIVGAAALASVLFLGGWQVPWITGEGWWYTGLQVASMLTKTLLLVYLQMLVRWTLPRLRYDQLMRLGWQYLLPLTLLNILVTGVVLLLVS